MRLIGLCARNATGKWWRSLTLGFLIFAVSFVLVVSNSLIMAVEGKINRAISSGITGQVQIRSDRSMEDDMVVQYSKGWDALKPINAHTVQKISAVINDEFQDVRHYLTVRQSAFFSKDGKREETMLIGIEPGMDSYKDAFLLKEGRYLKPEDTDGILLTEEQANSFGVKTGDSIHVTTKNRFGLNTKADFKVVGIGNFVMLSLFSYKACYLDSRSVRKLIGLNEGEATDIILFLNDSRKAKDIVGSLSQKLANAGIDNVVTADEKLSSGDLEVKDIDLGQMNDDGKVKISSWEEMGMMFRGLSDTMSVMLNILVLFLIFIIAVLILNLVYTMGMERYTEIGTLRAIGFSKLQVVKIFMGEILSICIMACIAGSLAGAGLVLLVNMAGIPMPVPMLEFIIGKTLSMELDAKSLVMDVFIIIVISFAASFYPAYRACSTNPAQAIRAV